MTPVTEPAPAWTEHRQLVADLYTEARDGVYHYLLACGLDAARSQEVTQEAFLRLYAVLREGGTIDNPKGWVYRVAHNIGMDTRRRSARESAYSEAAARTVADLSKSAEEELVEKEWLEGFRDVLNQLSKQQRLCLELRAQGLQYREIADVLRIRTSTVGEFLRRAVKQVRKWNRCRP
jgi:RNA polymerase sigma-70 factor (ECF subfamily)